MDILIMKTLLIAGLLVLGGCASTSFEQPPMDRLAFEQYQNSFNREAKNTNIFTRNSIVERFTTGYAKQKYHKAFAFSESGAWAYKTDFVDPAVAIEGALGACKINNVRYQDKQPCKIVNLDNYWAADFFK